jgi:hypothetical protein
MKKSIALTLFLIGILADQGHATGGLDCTVKDKNLQFEMLGSVGRSTAMVYIEQQAAIEIFLPAIASKFTKQDLKGKIIHSWVSPDEIRFQFETDTPETSLTFTVMTKNIGKDSDIGPVFEGTYEFVISVGAKTAEAKGAARCELY